ncbi:MAG: ABC transporter ATP-binding protein [Actinobacteria bacterium]|nr:ABC transporter ATP-binding protein [Actinomycetota bacterium]
MLEVTDLHVSYGPISALRGVSLRVEEGGLVAVVGPNGAGKSTLLWSIAGDLKPAVGEIAFAGDSILGRRPEDIVRLGIALVPEARHVFSSLTVRENLRLGMTVRRDRRAAAADLRDLEERFPVLAEMRSRPAGTLSGGQQQQLVIARALLCRPRLLVLDEPSLGLDPHNVTIVFETLKSLQAAGTTVLLVEQNAAQSIEMADRAYVIRNGLIEMEGDGAKLLDDERFAEMYLGAGAVAR